MLSHTFNNGIAVVASYLASQAPSMDEVSQLSAAELYNTPSILIVQTAIFILLAIGGAIVAAAIIKSIAKDYRNLEINDEILISGKEFLVLDKNAEIAVLAEKTQLNNPERILKSIKLDSKKIRSLKRTLTIWNENRKNPFEIKYFIPIGISVIMYFVILGLQLTKI